MASLFERDGISFRYPESWRLELEDAADGWTATLQSPGTAFLTLAFDEKMPPVEEMADAAAAALREEYPTLDAEEVVEKLADQMAVGHDISFISLDLTNTCWTRSFYSDTGTVLLLCQVSDLELEEYGPTLRAVSQSLHVKE